MSVKDYIKSIKIVKKSQSGQSISNEDMKILLGSIRTEQKVKSTFHFLWNLVIGISSIVAAIFSILAYFN